MYCSMYYKLGINVLLKDSLHLFFWAKWLLNIFRQNSLSILQKTSQECYKKAKIQQTFLTWQRLIHKQTPLGEPEKDKTKIYIPIFIHSLVSVKVFHGCSLKDGLSDPYNGINTTLLKPALLGIWCVTWKILILRRNTTRKLQTQYAN